MASTDGSPAFAPDRGRASGPDRRRAFGLELRCELALPSLPEPAGAPAEDLAPTVVRGLASGALDRMWPVGGGERILQEGVIASPQERYAERHPDAGFRLHSGGFGEATISLDGRSVAASALEQTPGRLERFLVGRVLPWAALVRGIEVFHAAAVDVHGRAAVLVGQSGAGKTSLAVRLVLGGAGFLTDDVLAVDRGPGGALRAHAGARVAGLRPPEHDRLAGEALAALGPMRTLDDKAYVTLTPVAEPVPLGAVFFITRPSQDTTWPSGVPVVERLSAPPPELLLASTFVLAVRTPQRLANLLEICADIAATVPQYRVRVRPGDDAAVTAAAIRAVL